jgi:hypothetical protein
MSPVKSDWQRIYVCTNGTPDPQANAILYVNGDLDTWANLLKEYLAEGRKVAVVGENAQEVVARYQQL